MYKRDKTFLSAIPPEWRDVPIGTLCNLDGETVTYVGTAVSCFGKPTGKAGISYPTKPGGIYREAPYSSLAPLKPWIPQPGEVVAAWDNVASAVVFGEYDRTEKKPYPHRLEGVEALGPCFDNIARIPDDFKLTAETLTVAWWIANGEIYEVGDE